MSLVKFDDKTLPSIWKKRDKKATRHLITGQPKLPIIDYDKLRQLVSIDGLRGRERDDTTPAAHKLFMARYKEMFVPEEPKKGFPIHTISRSVLRQTNSPSSRSTSNSVLLGRTSVGTQAKRPEEASHDVKDYVKAFRQQKDTRTEDMKQEQRVMTLRRLLRKLPFERTVEDADEMLACLKHMKCLSSQLDDSLLRELSLVATLDVWKDPGLTIFGNIGLHLVLKGTVQPFTDPPTRRWGDDFTFACPTPEPVTTPRQLGVCECFGTLCSLPDRDVTSKVFGATMVSDHVELMLITCTQFARINEKLTQDKEMKRIELLQKCKPFHMWSRQPLIKMAAILTYADFPPNTVLVSEGYQAPFAAIIMSGECHVLRQVDILKELPDGRKEAQMKQVLMGQLGQYTTFGEISAIQEEPMTCTILTATDVKLALIEPSKLSELDQTTVQLLLQSSEPTYSHLSLDAVREEYVKQEMKREWNAFKHNTIISVINSRGIRPGYGKWAKN